ncbi:MAG: metallophosphoesterase family protein [Desulfarculus sp.]|nr:metallophosphoesterase family protein [Desulfarculus sp.]
MPRLAVLSDLHANLAACQAVAADLRRRQPDQVLVLGDLVGYLTRPNQVVELVGRAGWQCLAGNYDQAVLTGGQAGVDTFLKPGIGPEPRAVFAWTETALDQASRAFLAGLPQRINLAMAGQTLLAVHGSPSGVRHYVHPDHPDAALRAWLTQAGAGVLLMGHTHVPFVRQVPGGLALNPGSVGKPKDGDPRASYAILDFLPQPQARIIRLDYDLEQEARLLRQAGLPAGTVEKLRQGI